MGWTSSADMKQQLRLRFDTKEAAVAYAEREGHCLYGGCPNRPRAHAHANPIPTISNGAGPTTGPIEVMPMTIGPVAQLDRAAAF